VSEGPTVMPQYRVLLGSSQVLPAASLADAINKATLHQGWVQRYEPGTADEPGDWFTIGARR
jgi:hypothetical protein